MTTATKAKKTAQNTEKKAPEATAIARLGSDDVVVQSEMGLTTINEEVVAKIAGLAVREVQGVHGLVPFGASQALSNIAHSITGTTQRDLGVRVEVGKVEAAVDVRIVAIYGASIPMIAENIRKNLEDRIGTMTGLRVKEVNIDVLDLFFAEDVPLPVAKEPVRSESRVQ